MEEVLGKDIFIEKDLIKYSPDYTSQNIFFRMQLRREMVKDTHNHGVLKSSHYQKKNITKTKNSHKLKIEVEKLRAYFQNKDLQNQCMLKYINRITQKTNARKNNKFGKSSTVDKDLKDGEFRFIYNLPEEQVNLVLENDNRFQLSKKRKCNRLPMEKYKGRTSKSVVTCNTTQNDETTGNVISLIENVTSEENNNTFEELLYTGNEYKNDLQSLLIRLTINSTMDDKAEMYDTINKNAAISEQNQLKIDAFDFQNQSHEVCAKIKSNELVSLLNIQPISMGLNQRQKYIIKKYTNLWKLFVSTIKENRVMQERQNTLKQFFEKLSKKQKTTNTAVEPAKKAKAFAQDYNSYRHRYKLQKHIIALQKAKLEEQNKLIEQLKYTKIVEDSKQSIDNMKEDIRKTYYEIDKHLKPKIKCLTNDLKIKELDDSALVLHCLKVPQFLQRMEARAKQREEKHAIIRERRKQLEEERIRLKQQAEISKAEMDKEEQMKKIKELRQKRKREKVENIRKKQHAERMRALQVMADLHYEKNLLVKYGIRPLKRLIELKYDNIYKAERHHRFQLMKNVFLNWMWYTEDMWFERNYKAENFYRKSIMKTVFKNLQKNHYEFILKKQVAADYYDLYVTKLIFRKFRKGIEIVKKEFEVKWMNAIKYYNSNILFRTFTSWTSLPTLNALKRAQDARKLKWRQKVLLVVPDYKPPED